MKEESSIQLHFLDGQVEREAQRLFGSTAGSHDISLPIAGGPMLIIHKWALPDEFLLAIAEGRLRPDAVLLNISYSEAVNGSLSLCDIAPGRHLQQTGISILRTLKRLDPTLPVIALTDVPDLNTTFDLGAFGADDFLSKDDLLPGVSREDPTKPAAFARLRGRVMEAITHSILTSIYDRTHQTIADDFAQDYDEEENRKAATVAYYHFENAVIAETVERKLRTRERVKILDIGCGTGRIEMLLSTLPGAERIDVTGIDFSPKMLGRARVKLQNLTSNVVIGWHREPEAGGAPKMRVSLYRAVAENLIFLRHRVKDGFDLIITGFGLLSYVNVARLLPPLTGAARGGLGLWSLLRDAEGVLLYSAYNEDSLIYRRIARLQTADAKLPIAALLDLEGGFLLVGERRIACEAYTQRKLLRLLRRAGFLPDPEQCLTFPVLHLMLNNDQRAPLFERDPNFPPGVFSSELFSADCDSARVLPEFGHYIVGTARRIDA